MKFNLKNLFTRREILETASLAGLGAALLPAVAASQQKEQPPNYQAGKEQPQSYQVGKDPGKHEPLANFKYDIESTTGWVGEAGSAKEATVAEFPASQNIAGVSMRLKPGAIRELHWHAIAAEWALVLTGTVRSTVISPNGQGATDVFEPGDICISRRVMATRCKISAMKKRISCWGLTTVIFLSSARSVSRTG